MVATGKYQLDGSGNPDPETYVRTAAREFAYDSPRARYLSRDLIAEIGDPNEFLPTGTQRWTDYLGDSPYGDFDVTLTGGLPGGSGVSPVVSESMRYLGTSAQQQVSGGATRQYHGDLIGSTGIVTNSSGSIPTGGTASYSAFGEILDPNGQPGGATSSDYPRYQYAGGWAYESPIAGATGPGALVLEGDNPDFPPIVLQHVGARWYQPEIGRFVQRDPIGLAGGWNVYSYVDQSPTVSIDPEGFQSRRPGIGPRRPDPDLRPKGPPDTPHYRYPDDLDRYGPTRCVWNGVFAGSMPPLVTPPTFCRHCPPGADRCGGHWGRGPEEPPVPPIRPSIPAPHAPTVPGERLYRDDPKRPIF